jgi:hypothetical protein
MNIWYKLNDVIQAVFKKCFEELKSGNQGFIGCHPFSIRRPFAGRRTAFIEKSRIECGTDWDRFGAGSTKASTPTQKQVVPFVFSVTRVGFLRSETYFSSVGFA